MFLNKLLFFSTKLFHNETKKISIKHCLPLCLQSLFNNSIILIILCTKPGLLQVLNNKSTSQTKMVTLKCNSNRFIVLYNKRLFAQRSNFCNNLLVLQQYLYKFDSSLVYCLKFKVRFKPLNFGLCKTIRNFYSFTTFSTKLQGFMSDF